MHAHQCWQRWAERSACPKGRPPLQRQPQQCCRRQLQRPAWPLMLAGQQEQEQEEQLHQAQVSLGQQGPLGEAPLQEQEQLLGSWHSRLWRAAQGPGVQRQGLHLPGGM